MHWTSEFYTLLDKGDPAAFRMISPDISVQVGNHPVTHGIDAMMAGELGRHSRASPTCAHQFLNVWDLAENLAALDSIVTYHRVDGRAITIPVLTIIHRNQQRLIDSFRLFLDNRPLFEGLAI